MQPRPYLCSSTGLVTPTGRQPGDKESLAGSAPGHPTDPLSTSSSGDCSASSWHCSCPEQSAGCGFAALFLIHTGQRKIFSPPRGREMLQTARPCDAKKSGWETPGPLPGGAQPRAAAPGRSLHQQPRGDFSGRALQPLTNKSCSPELFVQWGLAGAALLAGSREPWGSRKNSSGPPSPGSRKGKCARVLGWDEMGWDARSRTASPGEHSGWGLQEGAYPAGRGSRCRASRRGGR